MKPGSSSLARSCSRRPSSSAWWLRERSKSPRANVVRVVHVREDMVADESTAVAQGLRERFAALAEEHDGWYDPDPATRA